MSSRRPRLALAWMILAALTARSVGAEGGETGRLQPRRPADPLGELLPLPRSRQGAPQGRPAARHQGRARRERDGAVVVPGNPASELYRRVVADDPEEQMPPKESGRSLTAAQVETLKAWIEQGAEWKGHWAYIPPARPAVPARRRPGRSSGTPIDRFVLAQARRARA